MIIDLCIAPPTDDILAHSYAVLVSQLLSDFQLEALKCSLLDLSASSESAQICKLPIVVFLINAH